MRRVISGAFAFVLSLSAILPAQTNAPGTESQPPANRIPNSAEQGKVDRALRDKYKSEFASRDPGERGALGKKLREAADAGDDSIAKFVYLREARDLAVDAGDFSYSMEVIDDIARSFPIDAEEMKATALAAGVDRARVPPAEMARNYLKVSDEAFAVWNLDLAEKAAYLAEKVSTGNRELLDEAKKREKLSRVRTHEVLLAVSAKQKLDKNPDDPDQNQIIGRHLCFNMNHWETGLLFLAKSASPALKDAAQRELDNPTDAAAMAALGDVWWDLSDPKANIPAGATHRRAAYWYAKALPGLTGDKRAEVEKRISVMEADESKP